MKLLSSKEPHYGSVVFVSPPGLTDMDDLESAGLKVEPIDAPEACAWALRLRHPVWGEAEVLGLEDSPTPDPHTLAFAPGLTDHERTSLAAAGGSIAVRCEARTGNVLRDRKGLLFFLARLMKLPGALAASDVKSTLFWTADALADELSHDADLDPESLFVIHAITNDGPEDRRQPYWLHTHGLAEVGGFDVDILAPHKDFVVGDVFRAMALLILSGEVAPDTPEFMLAYGQDPVKLVPVGEFHRSASKKHAQLRDNDEWHRENRSVVCDAGRAVAPAKLFQRPSDGLMLPFSDEATQLMAARARATWAACLGYCKELAPVEPQQIVKVGLPIKGGGHEHAWFEVNAAGDRHFEATLLNDLRQVQGIAKGKKAKLPVEMLTDWLVATPFGNVTPRNTGAVRFWRQNREKIMQALRDGG